jgi:hypothetical protein
VAAGIAWRVVVAGVVGWRVRRSGSSAVVGRVVAADVGRSSGSVGPVGPVELVGLVGLVGPSGPVSLVGPVGAVEGDGGAVDVQFPAVVVEAAVMVEAQQRRVRGLPALPTSRLGSPPTVSR